MKRMPRRIFTEEFKKEAVRLFKQQDLTLVENILMALAANCLIIIND